ncbi:flagellar hook-length control protein FliK [Gallaecimonas kandeliae]|uniref:flagellar hook-length control protein FliK n=1 Tax=Gallaecimonas kandeliae TaxID=3029055 RepID=UPI0026478CD6|nr:flagellar hook-length control protein FliK [Gallaecimonas kandeliae]WKE66544.1 flagellar hook-length control protein FliK [Gallaecimonas kandeliae]
MKAQPPVTRLSGAALAPRQPQAAKAEAQPAKGQGAQQSQPVQGFAQRLAQLGKEHPHFGQQPQPQAEVQAQPGSAQPPAADASQAAKATEPQAQVQAQVQSQAPQPRPSLASRAKDPAEPLAAQAAVPSLDQGWRLRHAKALAGQDSKAKAPEQQGHDQADAKTEVQPLPVLAPQAPQPEAKVRTSDPQEPSQALSALAKATAGQGDAAPLKGQAQVQLKELDLPLALKTVLPSAAAKVEPAATALANAPAQASLQPLPEWAPVKVATAQGQWQQDLMAALGDRLQLQLHQQIKEARVRLDPPDLGRVEMTVRLDGDRLSVQLQASHPQVRDALTQQLDRLRLDLVQGFGSQVEVSVGQQGSGDSRPQTPIQVEAIAAAAPAPEAEQQAALSRPAEGWVSALA